MNVYQANIELLSQKDDPLAQRVESSYPLGEMTLGREGHPTLKVPDDQGGIIALHSNYDPFKESQRLIKDLEIKENDLIVLLGLGLGYHALELLGKVREGVTVLIVEADAGVFRAAMEALDLGAILRREDVILSVGCDQDELIEILNQRLNLFQVEEVKMVEHPPSLRMNQEYYRWVKELVKDYINITLANLASLDGQGWIWHENALANLAEIVEDVGVKELFGRFPRIPAVVISAGPSLDRNVELLRDYQDGAIIISVDTALKVLERRGLAPHIVVSVDGLADNVRHFEGAKTDGLCLVAEPMTHPDILKNFGGRKLIASIGSPIVEWVEEFVGEKGELKAGGSVSTIAFQLARLMGCDPIVLIGQDLSFPGGKFYAQGTYRDDVWSETANRFHSIEMSQRNLIDTDALVMVRASGGGEVPTHSNIAGYLRWFKYEVGKTSATVINATGIGADIEGSVNMTLSEVLERYCSQELEIGDRLESLTSAKIRTAPWEAISQDLANKIDELVVVEENLERGMTLLHKLLQLSESKSDISSLFAEFMGLDLKITSNPVTVRFLEPVLQKSLIRAERRMNLSSESNPEGPLADCLSFYHDMMEAAIRMRGLLKKALQKIE